MPVDEDREAQAQHVCHPLSAVDHGHRAHFSRGQQRWEVKKQKTGEEQQQLFLGFAAKHMNVPNMRKYVSNEVYLWSCFVEEVFKEYCFNC